MPERSSPTQRTTVPGGSSEAERPRLALVTAAVLFVLALAVLLLRFQRLSELPPGLNRDEGIDGFLALQVLQGEHAIFFPVDQGREPSAIYALALSTSLFGRTLLAMHLPTALGSAFLVFAVFWLGRLLFAKNESGRATPWRGLLIGGLAAGMMAVSISQTVIGRTSYNKVTHMPLLLTCCMALLWWGWSAPAKQRVLGRAAAGPLAAAPGTGAPRRRNRWRIALAGVCAGLLPYTYIPARFTPFVFLFLGVSFLFTWSEDKGRGESSALSSLSLRPTFLASRMRAELPWAGLFVGVTALVAAPILIYFALHPEHFFMRSREVWFLRDGPGGPMAAFLRNAWDHLLAFGLRGDPDWRHNYPAQSMLNPWEALSFWLGVGVAARRWRRPAYRLLLLWLGVMLLPALLSRDDIFPHFLRMMGATPAIYLLTAVGLGEAFIFLWERRRALAWRGGHSFRQNGAVAAIALGVAVSALILAQGVRSYRAYFTEWAAAPEVYEANETQWTELARTLNSQPAAAGTAYLLPYTISEHFSFSYLYHGQAPADVIPVNVPYIPHEIRSSLAAVENVATVKFVDWRNDYTGGDPLAEEHIVALLAKFGRYTGSDDFSSFQIHTFTDVDVEPPWTLYERLEPLPIRYEGGIDLEGVALGEGGKQHSVQQPPRLEAGSPLWAALHWLAAPGPRSDSSLSLRLYDAEGRWVYQKDAVLLDPIHRRTSLWTAGQTVDNLFFLAVPSDLPPGEYELRLLVYDTATLKPTFALGAGEPEVVLTRLHLAEGR